MEVALTLIAIYIVWRIIKYIVGTAIKVNQLYNALKDVRITTFTNKEFISEIFNIDFLEGEEEVKKAIGLIIIASLKNNGFHVEYIPGNYKLTEALTEAINDIYQIVEEKKLYINAFKD